MPNRGALGPTARIVPVTMRAQESRLIRLVSAADVPVGLPWLWWQVVLEDLRARCPNHFKLVIVYHAFNQSLPEPEQPTLQNKPMIRIRKLTLRVHIITKFPR